MVNKNTRYIECGDCAMTGSTGMLLTPKGSYECQFGYNDCPNTLYANKGLESGRTISDFSDIRALEAKAKLSGVTENQNDISAPETPYNNMLSEKAFGGPVGKTGGIETIRAFPSNE